MPRTASSAGPSGKPGKPAADASPDHLFRQAVGRAGLTSEPVAVAFSGGPDSTALLHMTIELAKVQGIAVTALIVDHGLRSESAEEAESAAVAARQAGANAVVLTWQGSDVKTGIQHAARNARYRLMSNWCHDNGVHHVLLGHHLDDQAATVLMRLRNGSGVGGLAAMREVTQRLGMNLVRPLLAARKSHLVEWLQDRNIRWIEDPSNQSQDFERNRINGWLARQDTDAHLAERLARLADRSARAEDALQSMAEDAWNRLAAVDTSTVSFDLPAWRALPEEIAIRITARAIREVTMETPGLAVLEDTLVRLKAQQRANLAGALLSLDRGRLKISPEPARR
jgi:tRNA(Ile)-lysidine synthase